MAQKHDCIFCKIVEGKSPSHKIWENSDFVAFLSIFPNTQGFSVVASKNHYPSDLFSLDTEVFQGIFSAGKEVSLLLGKKLDVARCAIVAEGLGVDHAHIKIIPLHGLKNKKWQEMPPHVDKYFSTYEGYISSHDYCRADDRDLSRLAEKIRK